MLFNSLSEDAYQHEIDTLRQLDESQFPIVTNAKSVKNIFGGPEDGPLLRSLQSKLESKFIDVEPVKPDYCTIDRFTDAIIVIEVSCAFALLQHERIILDFYRENTAKERCIHQCTLSRSARERIT